MKDSGMPHEPLIRSALRFTGSEALAAVVENTLINPELRREFARRSFYLFLRTETPVEVPHQKKSIDRMLNGFDPLERYNAGIAQSHKGQDLYIHHYPLSSRVIGGAEYVVPNRGLGLLFRLAIGEYEKQRLLAPPFNDVMAGGVFVTHEINEHWLADDVLTANGVESQAMQNFRTNLGANHASIHDRGYLPDSYYVTHPSAVFLRNQWRTEDDASKPG